MHLSAPLPTLILLRMTHVVRERRDTIIGGAVNLASRLEHEAQPGEVLISYETFAHVNDEIECEERGQIRVRGLAYPVATYRVGVKEDAAAPHAFRTELAHLKLEVQPQLMSREERNQALAALRKAADMLADSC